MAGQTPPLGARGDRPEMQWRQCKLTDGHETHSLRNATETHLCKSMVKLNLMLKQYIKVAHLSAATHSDFKLIITSFDMALFKETQLGSDPYAGSVSGPGARLFLRTLKGLLKRVSSDTKQS